MGRLGWPDFYETKGDAVEDAKKSIAKIETNKYTKKDFLRLVKANTAIMQFILEDALDEDFDEE